MEEEELITLNKHVNEVPILYDWNEETQCKNPDIKYI